jgi:high affinity sulfate transporter 1
MTTQGETSAPSRWERSIPILAWARTYDRSWLRGDVIAGLTLWGLVAPEAMAYAGIAGLPPQTGLYTLLVSLLIYALLGTSRHLSVGPNSATAALLASTVLAMSASAALGAGSNPVAYQAVAMVLVAVVGVLMLLAGVARLGFITQFLSKPVMDGFMTGLAIFVAIGQLNKLFGIERVEGNSVEKLLHVVRELPTTNWVTFAVGVAALALLFLLPRMNKKIPAGLLVLFLFIGVSALLSLDSRFGVEVVGRMPQGLPRFTIPSAPLAVWMELALPAIGIVLLAYSESLGVAREFAEKHGYEIDPNQELIAQGVGNVVSSFFGGMIAAGSVSSSAVKEAAGAHSQVANLVTWGAIVLTVLVLTPLFSSLPEAVLAALIIHAVWHIIASRKLAKVRLLSRTEWLLGLATMAGVLLFDVLPGMVIGLLASLLLVIYRSSRPHVGSLGRRPEAANVYSDLERNPENDPVPGVLIVRPDGQLYYANAITFREEVDRLAAQAGDGLHTVVFDMETQDRLDMTSDEVLQALVRKLQASGLTVLAAEVHAPVREFAGRTGLLDLIGEGKIHQTLDEAVRRAEQPAVGAAESA